MKYLRTPVVSLEQITGKLNPMFDKEKAHNIDAILLFITKRMKEELTPYDPANPEKIQLAISAQLFTSLQLIKMRCLEFKHNNDKLDQE